MSATNDVLRPVIFLFWYTDLISCAEYATTLETVLEGKVLPLIDICSPTEKDPDVWLIVNSNPLGEPTTYPEAPLLRPLIYEVSGESVELTVWLRVSTE